MEFLKQHCYDEYVVTDQLLNKVEEIIDSVDDFKNTDQNLLCVTSFQKIFTSFKATIVLCNSGYAYEVYSIARTMFETICIMINSCKNKNFATEYKNSHLLQQRKMLNKITHNQQYFSEELKKHASNMNLARINEEIERLSAKEFKVYDLAKTAELENLYLTFYAIASDYVHGSISNFSNYIKNYGDSDIIDDQVTVIDIKEALLNVNYLMLIALEHFRHFINFDKEGYYDEIAKSNHMLFEKLNTLKYQ